jgi:hypothetical protein
MRSAFMECSRPNAQPPGAALDVFEQEPLPPNHPLVKMDNVLLTPYLAFQWKQPCNRGEKRPRELRILSWNDGNKLGLG